MVLPRGDDFSVQTTQEDFRKNLRRLPTSPELRAARQQPLSPEAVKLRQCKLGELFCVAAFSRLDICDRLARIASLANSLQGSDVYRASNLVTTVPARRQAAILKCASSPYPGPPARGEADGRIRSRAGEVHCGAMTLVCWSVAIFADQLPESKCRLGYVMGLTFSTLNGPCHFLQWASKLTRKLAKSCWGVEVFACSDMLEHTPPARELFEPSLALSPGMIGFEDGESLSTYLRGKRAIAERYRAGHPLGIQQSFGSRELGNAFSLPGFENPADGSTKVKSDMAPPYGNWDRAHSPREYFDRSEASPRESEVADFVFLPGLFLPFSTSLRYIYAWPLQIINILCVSGRQRGFLLSLLS